MVPPSSPGIHPKSTSGIQNSEHKESEDELVEKWWERMQGKAKYKDKILAMQNEMTREGRTAEIPKALDAYKKGAFRTSSQNRQYYDTLTENVRMGIKGYSTQDRERLTKWEITKMDHKRGSLFLRNLAQRREQYEQAGYNEREIDNVLWRYRADRMVKRVSDLKKKGSTRTLPSTPKIIQFNDSERNRWHERLEFQSSVLLCFHPDLIGILTRFTFLG
ncbi:hypothetical protein H0H93_013731 [Arthromyces matolae]|nr:hypothetical protein H0H93_013731 [Arthromyces matolae]